ncbi:MAG: PSD1 and planctomycete cytochrome C domain-containing protein [Planctomycetota bacterium]
MLLVIGWSGAARAVEADAQAVAFFEQKIRPLLVKHCYECHSTEGGKIRGGLLLDTAEGWQSGGDGGDVIIPGKPGESRLLEAISYANSDLEMPPKYQLEQRDVDLLTRWIQMGAPDPREGDDVEAIKRDIDMEAGKRFWAFVKPERPEVPQTGDAWAKTDIDRFIIADLKEAGLRPVEDADRATLIRRLTYDLTGLPPTPQEVAAFEQDKSRRAYEKLVDRLLASKEFGVKWGRHWLDLARYGESTGKTRNYPFAHAWRYRDYVINAVNQDKPYDRFLTEQIAGDLLPADGHLQRDEQRVATAFLAVGTTDLNERNAAKYKLDTIDEQIDTTCRTILAMTVMCARCHDHKFDPIPTEDYYALAGIFNSTDTLIGLETLKGGNNDRYRLDRLLALGPGGDDKQRQSTQMKKADLELQLYNVGRNIGRLQRTKETGEQLRKNKEQLARDKKRQTELKRQIAALKNKKDTALDLSLTMGVREMPEPKNCKVAIRGDHTTLGDEVDRGFLRVVGDMGLAVDGSASGRLELAQWLTHDDHPLTARVMVNRVWHHLFGEGIVRTVDNFGAMGAEPKNQPLLDYLAVTFREDHGWSLKKTIKQVVMSRTYRLSSDHNSTNFDQDPDNKLSWRMSRRRLDIEQVRDAMLAVSGNLDLSPSGGSPVSGLDSRSLRFSATDPDPMGVAADPHRTIYQPILRGFIPEMLATFDFADPSMTNGAREETTVAPQALFLMNNDFVLDMSRDTARRLIEEADEADDRVGIAYQHAFGREPSRGEQKRAVAYIRDVMGETPENPERAADVELDAWSGFCQALFASAEFRYID